MRTFIVILLASTSFVNSGISSDLINLETSKDPAKIQKRCSQINSFFSQGTRTKITQKISASDYIQVHITLSGHK